MPFGPIEPILVHHQSGQLLQEDNDHLFNAPFDLKPLRRYFLMWLLAVMVMVMMIPCFDQDSSSNHFQHIWYPYHLIDLNLVFHHPPFLELQEQYK